MRKLLLRKPSRIILVGLVLMGVLALLALTVGPRALAVQTLCFTCGHVVIPDPTGGTFEVDTCLADTGHFAECLDLFNGGGCALFLPDSCY